MTEAGKNFASEMTSVVMQACINQASVSKVARVKASAIDGDVLVKITLQDGWQHTMRMALPDDVPPAPAILRAIETIGHESVDAGLTALADFMEQRAIEFV